MSKALRVAMQEVPALHDMRSRWHPFHVTLAGTTPPCHSEFMELSDCMSRRDSSGSSVASCMPQYRALLDCLHAHKASE